jgi:hypothetical protein
LADCVCHFFTTPNCFKFLFALDALLDCRRNGKQSNREKRHHRHHGKQRHTAL